MTRGGHHCAIIRLHTRPVTPGQDLGVRYVLEGSEQQGGELTIMATL
jgi:hypothetical protein